ncbi:MAG: hypothetical protein ACJ751_13960 [Niastella sp.]|uniref:hypothetical protein n=1 Tax=Niastella sp. TaxID=1869183 RepID=UPI003899F2A6
MRKFFIAFCFIPFTSLAQEKIDMEMISKIKKEATDNSHVMDIAFHLTDVSGSRLTGSPGFMRAANWISKHIMYWLRYQVQILHLKVKW